MFGGTVIGAIGSGMEVNFGDYIFFLILGVGLGMFIAHRLTIVNPARVVNFLFFGTGVFVLFFIPVSQYFLLGKILTFDIFLSVLLLPIVVISFLLSFLLSRFFK